MQRSARGAELVSTRNQIDGVVVVASICRTATRANEATSAQLTEVVRHQALLLARPLRQLAHCAVATNEFEQQQPPQGMCQEAHELRWISGAV
jgi:hypothetical protein